MAGPGVNSTGKIASTGYLDSSRSDGRSLSCDLRSDSSRAADRRIARTYTSADRRVSSDASTVSVNGTNVPRCALTKSFCHRTRKSDCPGFPAIAASASARIASPSSRCVCSTCRSSAGGSRCRTPAPRAAEHRHMEGRERWRDCEYQYSRRPPHRACRLLQPCEHSALTNLLDHRRVVPPKSKKRRGLGR